MPKKPRLPAPVAWAREQTCKGSAKLVLFCLAFRCNKDWGCWPGIDALAKDTGLSEKAVRTAIEKLESLGLIATQFRYKKSLLFVLCPAESTEQKELQLQTVESTAEKSAWQKGYSPGWTDRNRFYSKNGV